MIAWPGAAGCALHSAGSFWRRERNRPGVSRMGWVVGALVMDPFCLRQLSECMGLRYLRIKGLQLSTGGGMSWCEGLDWEGN